MLVMSSPEPSDHEGEEDFLLANSSLPLKIQQTQKIQLVAAPKIRSHPPGPKRLSKKPKKEVRVEEEEN